MAASRSRHETASRGARTDGRRLTFAIAPIRPETALPYDSAGDDVEVPALANPVDVEPRLERGGGDGERTARGGEEEPVVAAPEPQRPQPPAREVESRGIASVQPGSRHRTV